MNDRKTYLLTIRTGYFVVVALFGIIAVLCVGVTGIYFGSIQQATKDHNAVAAARAELKDQQLAYEKRLGEQSARYAMEATGFVQSLEQLNRTIETLKVSHDRMADSRAADLKRATQAAEAAASEAHAARDRLAELTAAAKEVKATIDVAASAATAAASNTQETQRALENATYPVAVPPNRRKQ